jgi:hypothetical protein
MYSTYAIICKNGIAIYGENHFKISRNTATAYKTKFAAKRNLESARCL